jgi:hypothetical protein
LNAILSRVEKLQQICTRRRWEKARGSRQIHRGLTCRLPAAFPPQAQTQQTLEWHPAEPGMVAGLEQMQSFASAKTACPRRFGAAGALLQ